MRCARIWPPLLLGAVFFAACNVSGPSKVPELKVLLNSSRPVTVYDTSSIIYIPDYFFLENTYSPLLEYSSSDELVSGIAEQFGWVGNEARLRIRSGLKTIDGVTLDAADAELSLKRLFILGGAQYDYLRGLLCGGEGLGSLSDPCPGIEVRDSGRELVLKFSERKSFLFHLLTNITFAVIPKGAIDPVTLKIRDYRNTSGPYYVKSDAGNGNIELAANPYHYRYSEDMPQAVKIIPLTRRIENKDALDMLLNGEIDYLINGLVRSPDDKLGFVSLNPGYSVHFSQPVRLVYAVFTQNGLRKLTRAERFLVGAKLRQLYVARRKICESPDQIFRMEGALSREQLGEVRGYLNIAQDSVVKKKVRTLGVFGYFRKDWDIVKKYLPNIIDAEQSGDKKSLEEPDIIINACDVGFQDDVGLISYYLSMEFFDLNAKQKKEWFASYAAAPDKKERMKILRELHYKTLSDARVMPLALLPYASVARKPWEFNSPGLVSGDNLWRLRKR